MVLEGGAGEVWAVAFHPDRKHFYDGTTNGIRRWRVPDGQELGKQTGMDMYAMSVSKDQKWVACGTSIGASVWDAELRKKVTEVEGGVYVHAVDVAPDCTRFATGTYKGKVAIWSITTGEKLLGPLKQGGGAMRGVKFSPDGGRLATACYGDSTIRIFDAHNGDQLISIENPIHGDSFLPIVWSIRGQQLFAVSKTQQIKSFDSFTGSPLAEWQIHENSYGPMSIALSTNGDFIGSSAGRFVSFWDTSTHTQLGIIEETHEILSIALSPDGCRLAAGFTKSGSPIIWDLRLGGILPDSYLPGNVSTPFLIEVTFIHESLFLYTHKHIFPDCKSRCGAASACVQNGELIPIDV